MITMCFSFAPSSIFHVRSKTWLCLTSHQPFWGFWGSCLTLLLS